MKESADKKLAARLIKGDSQSFDVFFSSYFPRIYRFALSRLNHDHDLAEDTAQVVLCQAISKMSTYRGEAPLFSWLCTFCRYEISRQFKAQGSAPGKVTLIEDDPAVRSALESLLSASNQDPDVKAYQFELVGWSEWHWITCPPSMQTHLSANTYMGIPCGTSLIALARARKLPNPYSPVPGLHSGTASNL